MQLADVDRVYQLEVQLFPNPWPKAFFTSDLNLSHNAGLVVEDDARLVAYAMASFNDGSCHVTNVAVAPDYQRQGIGSKLIDLIEEEAAIKRCHRAYLEVRTTNNAAIKMYETLGYTVVSTRVQYYIDGDDAYVMEKELS